MSLPPEMRTVSSLRAEIDRMGEWLDRLHRKYEGQPPQALVDIAYEKLAEAVQALYRLE